MKILNENMYHSFNVFWVGLSVAGIPVLFGILGPIVIISLTVLVINILQVKKNHWLPGILTDWDFLPLWMHSLDPMDKVCKDNQIYEIEIVRLNVILR